MTEEKYIINPQNVMIDNDGTTVVLTPSMETIFVLRDVEKIIIDSFSSPTTIQGALGIVKPKFQKESFVEEECECFVKEAIIKGVLIDAQN